MVAVLSVTLAVTSQLPKTIVRKIIFINSHPIQYFAPLYRYMNKQGAQVAAWYASGREDQGLDKEFGLAIKWDIPLLEDYEYRFFGNNSWKPSHANGFWGLINLSMIVALFRIPKSVLIVHGWHYFTHLAIIMLGRLNGHTVCVRNETPLCHEKLKSGWKQTLKRFGLKYMLFPRIDYFLYIGNQNRLFYQSYHIDDKRLVRCPYAVDNERFSDTCYDTAAIKAKLGIPATDRIILYSGKYIPKKRPLDLLRAFEALNAANCWLVMVGEGELREQMEQYTVEHQLKQVILTGFVNQSVIAEYYAVCDVFVMCSTLGETWGLSVNEAMNFDAPVIVSDLTGCSDDLVVEGSNGYVFKTGDVTELATKLRQVLVNGSLSWRKSSKEVVADYSYSTILSNVLSIPEVSNGSV